MFFYELSQKGVDLIHMLGPTQKPRHQVGRHTKRTLASYIEYTIRTASLPGPPWEEQWIWVGRSRQASRAIGKAALAGDFISRLGCSRHRI